jgi:Flp pilus assembly protein TadG
MLLEYLIRKSRKFIRTESGGALAELAIMVPFLVVMLAAVTEIGRYFQTYTTLAKATRSSARYLSNHSINAAEVTRAANLVVCGKLTCAGGDEIVKGVAGGPAIAKANVCIETTATTVTVRIPRTNNCNPVPGVGAPAGNPYNYQPIFNLGALLGNPGYTLGPQLSPRTTMFKPAI